MSSVEQTPAADQVEKTQISRLAARADKFRNQRNLLIDILEDALMLIDGLTNCPNKCYPVTLCRIQSYLASAEAWRREDP